MDKPPGDGRLLLKFREVYHHDFVPKPIHPSDWEAVDAEGLYTVLWSFADINGWHDHDDCVIIIHGDKRGRTIYYKNAIQELEITLNSDEFHRLNKLYQEQHDHTWVEIVDGYNMVVPGFFYCGESKTGEEGCGARMQEDVVICDG